MTAHEKVYLGTIIGATQFIDPFETSGIKKEMLSSDGQAIHAAIELALSRGIKPDIMVIHDLDKSIPIDLLSSLSGAGNKVTVNHHIEQIKQTYKINMLKRIGILASGTTADNYDEIRDAVEKVFNETDGADVGDLVNLKDYWMPYIDNLEKKSKAGGKIDGVKSGFERLDRYIYGFQNRKLYCVGARPSEGKTALLLNLAWKCALAGSRVGLISVESGRIEVLNRIVSHDGRIPGQRLNTATFNEHDFIKMVDMGERLVNSTFYLYDKPNAYLDEVKSAARQMKRQGKIEILFIDYLQLINVKGSKNKIESVSEVSGELKQLARALDIPIVTAAQLGRDADNSRPFLGNMQHSSKIEQDADVAILIWNRKDKEDPSALDDYYLMIEKNRDGQRGFVRVRFDKEFVTFEETIDQTMPAIEKKRGSYGGR